MNRFKYLIGLILLTTCYHASSQNNSLIGIKLQIEDSSLYKKISDYKIYDIDISKIDLKNEFDFTLKMGNDYSWDLHLVENNLRSNSESYLTTKNGLIKSKEKIHTYKGFVNGNQSNTVRLSFYDNIIEGFIRYEGKIIQIIPLKRFTKEKYISTAILVCNEDDLNEELFLGNDAIKLFDKENLDLKSINYDNAVRIVSIAAEGDYEFYQGHTSSTNSYIESIINMAEDVYESTFNILFRIVYTNTYTTPNDPYTEAFTYTNREDVLYELYEHFNSDHPLIYSDVTFLFTGKPTDSIAGIAYTPGAYGAVKDYSTIYKTFAHELGHNFNGIHQYAENCGTSNASVMCQGLKKVPLYFSSSNISRINSNISNRLLTYNYFNDALCGNEVFSVLNVPYGATVSWPKSANLSFDGSSTGSTVTIYPTNDGASWVEPSITKGSTSVSFPRNNFWAGEPHDLELYCEGRGMLYTYDFYVTPFYDNDSIVWGVYPPPAEINVHGYGTATIYFDEPGFYDIWAYVANECGDGTYAYITDFYVSDDYYLLSPNPANNEIEITFNDDQSANSKSADLPEEEYLVTITDINGIAKIQKKYKGKRFTIPINNLKDGNYFVNLSNDKMNKTQQLIIKH